jgi:hypothetical protein
MSQPPDPTWAAPDSAGGEPSAEPGAERPAEELAPPGGYGTGGGYGGPPGGYGPAGGYGGPIGGSPALLEGPAPVLVSFAPPAEQSRLTVAFRVLLAIPHLVILYALGIAAEVVAFIGWFAALFTGNLPDWAHTFITGVVRWQARVYAYLFFLTGAYPPFTLDDEPYPVRLVTARARLNRAAVLFRLILAIPAAIVLAAVIYGMGILSFFFWLIALFAGRLPNSLHQAIAAVLRLQFRFYGYFFMVTGEYPWWGMFGDPESVPAPSAPAADAGTTPTAAGDPWRLSLSGAGKGLVSLFLAVGVAAWVVIGIVAPSSAGGPGSAISNARSLIVVGAAYSQLGSTSTDFESAVQACGDLSCVTAQDQKEATALRAFASSVSSAGITGSAAADANTLISDANGAAQSLDKLAASTSVAQYQSEVSGSPLRQQLNSLDSDYTKLVNDLRA